MQEVVRRNVSTTYQYRSVVSNKQWIALKPIIRRVGFTLLLENPVNFVHMRLTCRVWNNALTTRRQILSKDDLNDIHHLCLQKMVEGDYLYSHRLLCLLRSLGCDEKKIGSLEKMIDENVAWALSGVVGVPTDQLIMRRENYLDQLERIISMGEFREAMMSELMSCCDSEFQGDTKFVCSVLSQLRGIHQIKALYRSIINSHSASLLNTLMHRHITFRKELATIILDCQSINQYLYTFVLVMDTFGPLEAGVVRHIQCLILHMGYLQLKDFHCKFVKSENLNSYCLSSVLYWVLKRALMCAVDDSLDKNDFRMWNLFVIRYVLNPEMRSNTRAIALKLLSMTLQKDEASKDVAMFLVNYFRDTKLLSSSLNDNAHEGLLCLAALIENDYVPMEECTGFIKLLFSKSSFWSYGFDITEAMRAAKWDCVSSWAQCARLLINRGHGTLRQLKQIKEMLRKAGVQGNFVLHCPDLILLLAAIENRIRSNL